MDAPGSLEEAERLQDLLDERSAADLNAGFSVDLFWKVGLGVAVIGLQYITLFSFDDQSL